MLNFPPGYVYNPHTDTHHPAPCVVDDYSGSSMAYFIEHYGRTRCMMRNAMDFRAAEAQHVVRRLTRDRLFMDHLNKRLIC